MSELPPQGGSEGYEACDDEGQEGVRCVAKIKSRRVVPKEKFIRWVEQNTGGGGD